MTKKRKAHPQLRDPEGGRIVFQNEEGVAYRRANLLTMEEHSLHGKMWETLARDGLADTATREDGLACLNKIAEQCIPDPVLRKTMVEHITAYMDEPFMIHAHGPH